jgi:PLAC8 family
VLLIVCLYWVLTTITAPPVPVDVSEENDVSGMVIEVGDDLPHQSVISIFVYHTVSIAFGFYTLVILTKLRHRVRRLYHIPSKQCCGCENKSSINNPEGMAVEDCCMAFWCGCCSVAQLARQTTDYSQEPAACCSSTGLLSSSSSQPTQPTRSSKASNVFVV